MDSVQNRVEVCVKQIGDEAMSYAMALLILPTLMDMVKEHPEYKDYLELRKKKTH